MSSWLFLEGRFDGVVEQKALQNGTQLTTFKITEEARGTQEATTFSVTGFKEVAQTTRTLKIGTPTVVKCKIDSRSYTDKNGANRMSTELKAFAVYTVPGFTKSADIDEGQSIPF